MLPFQRGSYAEDKKRGAGGAVTNGGGRNAPRRASPREVASGFLGPRGVKGAAPNETFASRASASLSLPTEDGFDGRPSCPSGGKRIRTSETYMPDGSRFVVEEVTEVGSGNVTVNTTRYPAPPAAASGAPEEATRDMRIRNSSAKHPGDESTGPGEVLPGYFSDSDGKRSNPSVGREELTNAPGASYPGAVAQSSQLSDLRCTRKKSSNFDGGNEATPQTKRLKASSVAKAAPEMVDSLGVRAEGSGGTFDECTKKHHLESFAASVPPGMTMPGIPGSQALKQDLKLSGVAPVSSHQRYSAVAKSRQEAVPETLYALQPPPNLTYHIPHLSGRPDLEQTAPRSSIGPETLTGQSTADDEGNRPALPSADDGRAPETETATGVAHGVFAVPREGPGVVPPRPAERPEDEQNEEVVLPGFVVEDAAPGRRSQRESAQWQVQRDRDRLTNRAPLVEGVAVGESKGGGRGRSKVWAKIHEHPKRIAGTSACAVIVALALILGIVLTRPEDDSQTQAASTDFSNPKEIRPTNPPRSARYNEIRSALEAASSKGALDDTTSPQHRALTWLADEDALTVDPTEKEHLTQRFALSTLFFATRGDSWLKRGNFLSGDHECTWNEDVPESTYGVPFLGVYCPDDSQIVQNISLPMNNITGQLPEEITLLSQVRFFSFWKNNLGSIPSTIGRMKSLQKLLMFDAQLTGSIPQSVGELTELTRLYLDTNKLSGSLPDVLGNLGKLEECWLKKNRFTGSLPSTLNNLRNLKEFFVDQNSLTGTLSFTANSLPNLEKIALYFNLFSGSIPAAIFTYTKLEWLLLLKNSFTGEVPDGLENLSNMQRLDLGENTLRGNGIPPSIFQLEHLSWFSLQQNGFSGTISSEIGALSQLQRLYLSANLFNGRLPEAVGKLTALEDAHFSINSFSGTIPRNFSQLTSLSFLNLAFNSLTGDINFLCEANTEIHLLADCYGDNPEVFCSCCAGCCADEPEQMYIDEGLHGCFPNR